MSVYDKRGNVVNTVVKLSASYRAIKQAEIERQERNKKYVFCCLGVVGIVILLAVVF
jgi:hypothetical protein